MEELYGSSFFSYSVPEAVIKFRQGIGRLIRSASDRGVLVVLDNRIITKGYGKQFVLAAGNQLNEFNGIEGMADMMRGFFESPMPLSRHNDNTGLSVDVDVDVDGSSDTESNIRYVPFEDL
jgi:hypothetical protein